MYESAARRLFTAEAQRSQRKIPWRVTIRMRRLASILLRFCDSLRSRRLSGAFLQRSRVWKIKGTVLCTSQEAARW
jgi:hypothetical protein